MPKRHRQPEPIDIQSTAHHSHHTANASPHNKNSFTQSSTTSDVSSSLKSTSSAVDGSRDDPLYSPQEQKLVEETRSKAVDFPATPETLARHRRRQEAVAKRRRASYDRDGQPLSKDDAAVSTDSRRGTLRTAKGQRGSTLLPSSSPAANGSDPASDDDDGGVDDDDASELSSNDYVGDDGNQPSTDSELDSEKEDDEAELRGLHKAMAAAAAQRRRAGAKDNRNPESSDSADENGSSSSSNSETHESGDGFDDPSDEDEEGASDDVDNAEESSSDGDFSVQDEEAVEEADRAEQRHSDGDDEEEDGPDGGGLITIDFGVFEMEASNVDGLIHLMDQLCPDKMNEVDRDGLGLALLESPFTSVVRLQNNGDDATGDEAQEFYGLSSVLDVAHGQQLYPTALRPLCELLQQHVWRHAAAGIPPTDILTSVVDDDEHVSMSRAKCLLLISEYIRNIPLELTVQILEDVLNRLDATGSAENKQKQQTGATHESPIFSTQPSMLAVLAKVQRPTDAPVTLPKGGKQQLASPAVSGDAGESSSSSPSTAASSKRHHHGKKTEKPTGTSSGTMAAPEAPLDLANFIFWREEDSILYDYRDKRVAALVYRCRPQYDGQAEHEIPLSVLFVLQYGAARQAVEEMKRRQTANTVIERY
ncbi:hypothetical protein ABB37_01609 [Leptomonas pyrrhocoris]|uniref:Uncharacterized protein n=1 Tax=Leptomonas pyrrhocoris TaxID=157538 RepID=A0A0N1J5C5_LEPPY|nr:hypothetical protein ABB37_01609 [Leptomonas pyrrhocoris]KPA85264.1 hypothetical protein ABB37_01609 [Leptomonas pyrrhocoris]|eukprot:XP_015663703.1 hypothetical protein ABB37_01609 [Leptomonas pyrrhocoris]